LLFIQFNFFSFFYFFIIIHAFFFIILIYVYFFGVWLVNVIDIVGWKFFNSPCLWAWHIRLVGNRILGLSILGIPLKRRSNLFTEPLFYINRKFCNFLSFPYNTQDNHYNYCDHNSCDCPCSYGSLLISDPQSFQLQDSLVLPGAWYYNITPEISFNRID